MLSGKSPLLNCRSLVFVFILILGLLIFLLVAVSSEQAVGQSTPPPNTNCPGEGGGVCDTTPAECTNSANPPAVVGDETGWKSDPPIGGGTAPTINDVTTTWGSTVTLTVTNAPTSDDDTPTRTELIQHYKSPTPPECDPGIPNGNPVQGATEDLPTQSESITLSTTPSDGSFNESTFEFTPPDPAPGEECVPKTFSVTFIWDDPGGDPDRDDTPLKAVGNITVNPNVVNDCDCNGVSPRSPDILSTGTAFESTPAYSYGNIQGDSAVCVLSSMGLSYDGLTSDTDTLNTVVTTQSYLLPVPPNCDRDIKDGDPQVSTTPSTVNDSIGLTWSATGPDFVLNGNGATATFTAAEPGEYAVSLLVDDAGTGNRNDGSKTITHNITAIELSDVAFEGEPKLCVGGAVGETVTIQATATILPASRSIRWSMPNAPTGFSIDEGTGLITVTSEAVIGETGPTVRAEDHDSGLCYQEAAIPVLQQPTITIAANCPVNLDNGAVGAWVGDDLSLTVTTEPAISFSWEVDGSPTTPADNDADVDVPTLSSGNIKYTVNEELEGPPLCPLASAEIDIVIVDLSHLTAGGKMSSGSGEASTVFLAKDGWDEANTDPISQAISAITTPVVAEGQIGNWTATEEGASMDPSSGLNSSLTSTKFVNHSVTFTPVACGGGNITVGSASMNIAVGGIDISTANISESQEMSETYNIFLNENFDQELAKADPAGHQDCLAVDHSDDSLQGDAPDEFGQISFATLTHGDGSAKVIFETSTGGGAIKLYKSLTERLNFGTEYTIASLGETANFLVEGVAAGEVTLTAKLRTQDYSTVGDNAEAIDEIKIKVIPLNLIAVDPAPSEDAHEACHKTGLVIQLNNNDTDMDEIIDSADSAIAVNDVDLAKLTIDKPANTEAGDVSSGVNVVLPPGILGYENQDKSGIKYSASFTIPYSDLPVDIYLEAVQVSAEFLDKEITATMTLNSEIVCRDSVRYTTGAVDLDIARLAETSEVVPQAFEDTEGAITKCFYSILGDDPIAWMISLPLHQIQLPSGWENDFKVVLRKQSPAQSPGKIELYKDSTLLLSESSESIDLLTPEDLQGDWGVLVTQTGVVDLYLELVPKDNGGTALAMTAENSGSDAILFDRVRVNGIIGTASEGEISVSAEGLDLLKTGKIIHVTQGDELDIDEKNYITVKTVAAAIIRANTLDKSIVLIGRDPNKYPAVNLMPSKNIIIAGLGGSAADAGPDEIPPVLLVNDPELALPELTANNSNRHFSIFYDDKFQAIIGLRLTDGQKDDVNFFGGRSIAIRQVGDGVNSGEVYIGYCEIEDNGGPALSADFKIDADSRLTVQRCRFANNINPVVDDTAAANAMGGNIHIGGRPNIPEAISQLESTPVNLLVASELPRAYELINILFHQNEIKTGGAIVGGGMAVCGFGIGDNIQMVGCPVDVIENRFEENTARWFGAGAYMQGVLAAGSNFTGNLFVNNVGTSYEWNFINVDSDGGGIAVKDFATIAFDNNRFDGNIATSDGAGAYFTAFALGQFVDTNFSHNQANGNGGGLHLSFGSAVRLSSCNFSSNTASGTGSTDLGGGAIAIRNARLLASACNFSNNTAAKAGGGILVVAGRDIGSTAIQGYYGGYPPWTELSTVLHPIAEVTNCDFDGNQATSYGGGAMACVRYVAENDWFAYDALFEPNDDRKIIHIRLQGSTSNKCTITGNKNLQTTSDSHALGQPIGGVYWKDVSDKFFSRTLFVSRLGDAFNNSGLLVQGINASTLANKYGKAYTNGISDQEMVKDYIQHCEINLNDGYQFVAVNTDTSLAAPWHPANFIESDNNIDDPKILSKP